MSTPSLSQRMLPAKPTDAWLPVWRAHRQAGDGDLVATRLHTGRELRVAANFCVTQDEAVWLYRRLRVDPRLSDDQVQLLKPVDASPRRFAQRRHCWDSLRPLTQRVGAKASWAPLQASSLLGLLVGLGLGLLAGLSIIETLVAALLCTLLTLGISLVLRPVIGSAAQHRRFDRVLKHRLAHGQYAVVVIGVHDPAAANQAIATLRSAGVYWCAETHHKAH